MRSCRGVCTVPVHHVMGSRGADLDRHAGSRGEVWLMEAQYDIAHLLAGIQVVIEHILGAPDLHSVCTL